MCYSCLHICYSLAMLTLWGNKSLPLKLSFSFPNYTSTYQWAKTNYYLNLQ